jgi:hypothetical protein
MKEVCKELEMKGAERRYFCPVLTALVPPLNLSRKVMKYAYKLPVPNSVATLGPEL